MAETNEDGIVIEGLAKGKIHYGTIIMQHLDRVGKSSAGALGLDDAAKDTFFNTIRCLSSFLELYKDEEYKKELEKIKAMSEPKDCIATIDEYYAWLGLLMTLIRNAGLLPAEEKTLMDAIEDGENESNIILA
jgi:hypothetical protein